jgi:CHASE2 domain-containing sensor protein
MKLLAFLNLTTTPGAFFVMGFLYCLPAYHWGWWSPMITIFMALAAISFIIRRIIIKRQSKQQ